MLVAALLGEVFLEGCGGRLGPEIYVESGFVVEHWWPRVETVGCSRVEGGRWWFCTGAGCLVELVLGFPKRFGIGLSGRAIV